MKKGTLFISTLFLYISVCAQTQEVLYPFYKKEKTGWINNKGEIVIPPDFNTPHNRWKSDSYFHDGMACVLSPDGKKYGFINQKGEYITPMKFEDCEDFSEGLALVKENGKYGYINIVGDYEIFPQYDYADSFSEGLAVVSVNGLYGYINHDGEWAIHPKYNHAVSFSDAMAYITDSIGKGWIDLHGNIILRYDDVFTRFDKEVTSIEPFSCGVAAFECVANKHFFGGWKLHIWQLLKPNGEIINPQVEVFDFDFSSYKYDKNNLFSEGLACVGVVTDPTYNNVGTIGYYINTDGRVTIDNQIENGCYSIVDGERFSEGYAAVLLYDNKKRKRVGYGYINRLGAVVIAPQYDFAGEFRYGVAMVRKGHKAYYINKNGEVLFKFKN